jgi:STE24 endopeptidase
MVVVLCELAALPAGLHRVLRIESPYGDADLTVEGILGRAAQSALVVAAVASLAGLVVQLSVLAAGRWWWICAALIATGALSAALHATSLALGILGDVRPLTRETLVRRLRELASRTGLQVADVVEWRGTTGSTTAAVTGAGRRRRVLIASEVLRDWSDEEIAVVVAHEFAHLIHRDLRQTIGLDAVIVTAALAVATAVQGLTPLSASSPGALESLPVVAFVTMVVWLAATPARHALSRRQERRADRFALQLTGASDAFGAAVRRLASQHLAEERPSTVTRWFYHRHPSIKERLEYAEAYAQAGTPADWKRRDAVD